MKIGYKKALKMYKDCINKEVDQDNYDKKWELYANIFPLMIKGEVKTLEFKDFCKTLDGEEVATTKVNDISEEEALKMLNELENKAIKRTVIQGQDI